MQEPKLIFTEDLLSDLIQKLTQTGTLIITDDYNYPTLKNIKPCILVKDQEIEHIERIKQQMNYTHVIAVGGCTALDFGRACAVGKDLIVVPTILSNACFSADRSVINRNGVYKSERTTAPKKTIISLPTIIENHADHIKHWSASGLGDLLAAVSASIEFEFSKKKTFDDVTTDMVNKNVPLCMEALNWALQSFIDYDPITLQKLAYYLHESSVDVIRKGTTKFNAASEHLLYYKMQEAQKYQPMRTTHGRIVSIGNLITTRIFAEETGQDYLYETLRIAYKKVGLPLTFKDLESISIKRNHIVQGLIKLSDHDCLYTHYFSSRDFSILNRVFNS